ncbi:MAG: hypothetical protein ABIQ64_04285 [Candidatus Saccharimonadales bacterium]
MNKNIGPLNPEIPPYGEISLNDKPMTHHMDVPEFPEEGKERDVCMEHIQDGRIGDMISDFWLTGCHFPEENEGSNHPNINCLLGPVYV